jgi:hypothetical protein
MIVSVGVTPRMLRGAGPRYMVHIQVRTPAITVRVGRDEHQLLDRNEGLHITSADGIWSWWWSDALWVIADADGYIDVEFA